MDTDLFEPLTSPGLGQSVVTKPVTEHDLVTMDMPHLTSLFPTGCMQYDTQLPTMMFSEAGPTDINSSITHFPEIASTLLNNGSSLLAKDILSIAFNNNVETPSKTGEIVKIKRESDTDCEPVDILNILDDVKQEQFASNEPDVPILSLDDNSLFEAGDLSSLLEQFEEAAATLPAFSSGPTDDNEGIDSLSQTQEDFSKTSTSLPTPPPTPQIHKSKGESLINPDSEVVRLLKAKHPLAPNQGSAVVDTPPGTPPTKVMEKIRASGKRKTAIMLNEVVPNKSDRGKAVKLPVNYGSRRLQKILQGDSGPPSPASPTPSPETPPPKNEAKPERVKINLQEYKRRNQKLETSSKNSPAKELETLLKQGHKLENISTQNQDKPKETITVSDNYFKCIMDHDYCQNVPRNVKPAPPINIHPAPPINIHVNNIQESVNYGNMQVEVKEEYVKTENEATVENDNIEDENGSVLKSLLLNKGLEEEVKQQAVVDRAKAEQRDARQTCVNLSKWDNLDVIDMDIDDSHEESERFDKFENEQSCKQDHNSVNESKENVPASKKSRSSARRQYRRRGRSPTSDGITNEEDSYYDKLPGYFTVLSKPTKPSKISETSKYIDRGLPDRDRDPSPDRGEQLFDKLPAYYSCFTNSTRYDNRKDPLGLEMDDKPLWPNSRNAIVNSAQSSRSQTPNLVIASRANSHSNSRSPSPQNKNTRYQSRSRSKDKSLSRSRSYSHSSRSSSCSSDDSGSQCSRKESDSRYRSRSRDRRLRGRRVRRRSRDSYYSRSGSRSMSRSRSRSYSRSRSRSNSTSGRRSYRDRGRRYDRSGSSSKRRRNNQEKQTVEKKQQMEERRIVYVGRIENDITRRELRLKFEHFGPINNVSVHFREHGDNYGFVTFEYQCDAYAAIEKANKVEGLEHYDMCFGGRRHFCKVEYADLDGKVKEQEEMGGVVSKGGAFDFDAMLKAAQSKIKKKKL